MPGFVDQIGDGTWVFFPHQVFLAPGTYTARVAPGVCDLHRNCARGAAVWSFTVAGTAGEGGGDTRVPLNLPAAAPPGPAPAPAVASVRAGGDGTLTIAFSRPVLNVNGLTLRVEANGAAVAGRLSSSPSGDRWTFTPARPPKSGKRLSVTLSPEIYDLAGRGLAGPYRRTVPSRPD